MRKYGIVLMIGCLGLLMAPVAEAEDASGWSLSLGAFDVIDADKAAEGGIEYRWRPFKLWSLELNPMLGISGTSEGSFWVYGGARWELEVGDKWLVIPSFAVSLYEEGDGKDLGGIVEFRSSLEIARRLSGGSRIGLSFYHLSNARIYDLNPGSESLILVWSFGG